jgi:hypothetical protein
MENSGQLHGPVRFVPTEGAPITFLDYYSKRRKLMNLPGIE